MKCVAAFDTLFFTLFTNLHARNLRLLYFALFPNFKLTHLHLGITNPSSGRISQLDWVNLAATSSHQAPAPNASAVVRHMLLSFGSLRISPQVNALVYFTRLFCFVPSLCSFAWFLRLFPSHDSFARIIRAMPLSSSFQPLSHCSGPTVVNRPRSTGLPYKSRAQYIKVKKAGVPK